MGTAIYVLVFIYIEVFILCVILSVDIAAIRILCGFYLFTHGSAGGDRKTDLTLIDCSRSTVLLRSFLCLMRSDGIGFACKTADLK